MFSGGLAQKKRGSRLHAPRPRSTFTVAGHDQQGCNGKQITGWSLAAGIGLPLGNPNDKEDSASTFRRLQSPNYSSHLNGGQMSRIISSSSSPFLPPSSPLPPATKKNEKGPKKKKLSPRRKPPSPGLALSHSGLMTKKLFLHHEVGNPSNPSNNGHKTTRLYLFF